MSKIKWSWKLRIKKNTARMQRFEEVNRDLKDRLENVESEVKAHAREMDCRQREVVELREAIEK